MMGTTHIILIVLGGSLAVCVGLLIFSWWLICEKNREYDDASGNWRNHREELVRKKNELEERLKALTPHDARKKGAKTGSNNLGST